MRKILNTSLLLILIFFNFSCGQDKSFFPYDVNINLLSTFPDSNVRIAILGDSRRGDFVFETLQKEIVNMKPQPDLVIHLGDMIDHPGSGIEWYHFHELAEPLTSHFPFYPVVGNHDVDDEASQEIYKHQFPPPANELYYYLEIGDLLLIFLDSELAGELGKIDGEQFSWLENLLENEGARFRYRLAFLHRPLFPQSNHKGSSLDEYPYLRDRLHNLFVKEDVDIVFAAHEHIYDRREIDRVVYIISGGGGAPLVDDERSFYHFIFLAETNEGLKGVCISIDGEIMDEFLVK